MSKYIYERHFIGSSNPQRLRSVCTIVQPLSRFQVQVNSDPVLGALFTHIRSDSALCSYENASYQFVEKLLHYQGRN